MTRRGQLLLILAAFGWGCEEEVVTSSNAGATAPVTDRKTMAGSQGSAVPSASASGLPKVPIQEVEFNESERSRDPFRSYAQRFIEEARTMTKSQRQVVLADYGIDELRLVGIVSGVTDARAMLVDPTGRGHVVRRGQFVGKAEIVEGDAQGAPAYEINWRIDRIRDSDLVLVREDPKNPEVPSSTRVIVLHPEGDPKMLLDPGILSGR